MNVLKRINNNVVLVASGGTRMIVVGKGLGFKARPGDPVNEAFVQQRFVLQGSDDDARYAELIKGIPLELLDLARRVVQLAEDELDKKLPTTLVFTLADHIAFAIERARDGVALDHPLAWEIGQFYPREYHAGKRAAQLIGAYAGMEMPRAEASFLAIHFVNALGDLSALYDANDLAETMLHAVRIIEEYRQAPLDQTSMAFSRFITHLRYCLVRCLHGDADASVGDDLLEMVRTRYPGAFSCARRVATYVFEAQAGTGFSQAALKSEMLYLTLHINRLLAREPAADEAMKNRELEEEPDER